MGSIKRFFTSNTFISNAMLKFAKNQAKAKLHHQVDLVLFGNYSLYSSMLSSKNNKRYSEKFAKKHACASGSIRWHRYDINRPRPRDRHKYTEYIMYLSMMMIICIKEHLSIIWSSIHENLEWDWVKKKCCLYKKTCIYTDDEQLFVYFYSTKPLERYKWGLWVIKIYCFWSK